MKTLFKSLGFAVVIAAIAFNAILITGCNDDPPPDDPTTTPVVIPPEKQPIKDRWWKYVDPSSPANLEYTVDDDGLCTIVVTGSPVSNASADAWKAMIHYNYTEKVGASYIYKFEAWTESDTRNLNFNYFENNETHTYLNRVIPITDIRTTYTVIGSKIPENLGKNPALRFSCADKIGTLYIKILEIGEVIFNLSTWFGDYPWVENHSSWEEFQNETPPLYQSGGSSDSYMFNKTAKKITIKNIVNNWDGIDIKLDKIGVNPALNKIKIEIEGKILELNQTVEDYDDRGGQIRIQYMPGYGWCGESDGGLNNNDTFTITREITNNSSINTLRITSNAAWAPEESDTDHEIHNEPYVKSFEITKIIITNLGER